MLCAVIQTAEIRGKGKVVPVSNVKTCTGIIQYKELYSSPALTLSENQSSSSRPGHLARGKTPRHPIIMSLVIPQTRSERFGENILTHPGNELRIVSPLT
jgi:hypothetical protein